MYPSIIPLVQHVTFPTDSQLVRMFGLSVGKKTLRTKAILASSALPISTADKMVNPIGKPGSKERIAALRERYEQIEPSESVQYDALSPFAVSIDDMANSLAHVAVTKNICS